MTRDAGWMASQVLADWRPASEDDDALPADRVPGGWHDENSAGTVGVLPFFHVTMEAGQEDGVVAWLHHPHHRTAQEGATWDKTWKRDLRKALAPTRRIVILELAHDS